VIDLGVTLITPTRRYGGLDILMNALEAQVLPPDEWECIIIDDVPEPDEWKRRDEYIESGGGGMNITHVRCDVGPYWRSNRLIAHARNAGLVRARGRLVVFVDDYSWFPPEFLEEHLDTYEETPWCSLGPVHAVPWTSPAPRDLSTLGEIVVDPSEFYSRGGGDPNEAPKWRHGAQDHRSQMFGEQRNCPPGWFFSSNGSAPLEKIVECNGQWMLADCTSEEDVMLGLMLDKKGVKFWFRTHPEISVWHMQHGIPEIQPPRMFSEADLQKVTPEMFGTRNEGSWALMEYMEREGMQRFNQEPECKGWDLAKERERWARR